MKNKIRNNILAILIITFMFTGCFGCRTSPDQKLTLENRAFTVISMAADIYNSSLSVVGDLRLQNKISDEDYLKFKSISKDFWATYHVSVELFDVYLKNRNANSKQNLLNIINTLLTKTSDFKKYVNPLIQKYGVIYNG